MPKVTIPYTVTVNNKTYFAGEAHLSDKDAADVNAFLGTVPADNTLPVTDAPLPASAPDDSDAAKKARAKGKPDTGEE